MFQHTAARRRLDHLDSWLEALHDSFNTQPPEGGWTKDILLIMVLHRFNTQPPEGGWVIF